MEAVILCGGLGTRLRPAVRDRPKALAPVQGRPFLDYLIANLKKFGINRLVLATGYLSDRIAAVYGDGSRYGVALRYAVEPTALGTAGAVKHATALLETENFLVLNGDTYSQIDYQALLKEHIRRQTDLTVALRQVATTERFGQVTLGPDSRIVRFLEKAPEGTIAGKSWINAGVYVMNRRVLSWIPDQRRYALETELIPLLLQEDLKIYGWATAGYFRDIGVPEDYYQFIRDVAEGLI
jgi:D-glycero-alpha-D-manno-heptose 1-phosphate guanylyltransferase